MPNPQRDQDRRLAEALRDQRPGAVAHIYNSYGPRLFDYAEALLDDRDLAVEAVRAALLVTRTKELPDDTRFRAWLYSLVRDECLSRLGKRPRPRAEPPAPPPPRLEPGRLVFHYAMDDLERELADLKHHHGLAIIEVAEILGITLQQAAELEANTPTPEEPPTPPPAPALSAAPSTPPAASTRPATPDAPAAPTAPAPAHQVKPDTPAAVPARPSAPAAAKASAQAAEQAASAQPAKPSASAAASGRPATPDVPAPASTPPTVPAAAQPAKPNTTAAASAQAAEPSAPPATSTRSATPGVPAPATPTASVPAHPVKPGTPAAASAQPSASAAKSSGKRGAFVGGRAKSQGTAPAGVKAGADLSRHSDDVQVAPLGHGRVMMRSDGRRKKLVGATAGAAGVVVLAAGALSLMVLQPFSNEGGGAIGPQSAGGGRTPDTRFETPTSPPPVSPGQKPSSAPSAKPKDSAPPQSRPQTKPSKRKKAPPPRNARATGTLRVSDGSCRGIAAPISRSCTLSLTAVGGAVRWSVAGVNPGIARVSAGGGGTLASGRSTTVTVTIRPTVICYARGFGSATVSFAPGGSARVSYTCW
ncbi:hypothetical protein GCM10010411_01970 [Actinomadura fulvescens]|uniref:Uncharacterized protein n=1 Tax=Actinomadura fulvescens TaxID=46160 RepID=A0ABN3PAS1_9ACTN